jgi:uncharacterized repeat protein (TIGR03803 family)
MHSRRTLTSQAAVIAALAIIAVHIGAAQTSGYETLYSFKGGTDGESPIAGVILGKGGVLYGATQAGGASGDGTVFALAPASETPWTETVLHSFDGTDGEAPGASLVLGKSGSLFGTTETGGNGGGGTVFELTPPTTEGGAWTETTLYSFGNIDGPNTLYGGLLVRPGGDLFGTTFNSHLASAVKLGGSAFMLTPPEGSGDSWSESALLNFWDSAVGSHPYAGVISEDGSLYGTTNVADDGYGCGSVYKLTPPSSTGGSWTGTSLYNFGGSPNDGCNSRATLTVGPSGVLLRNDFRRRHRDTVPPKRDIGMWHRVSVDTTCNIRWAVDRDGHIQLHRDERRWSISVRICNAR